MAQLVVDELHETFAFYLAAIQRCDDDGVLRLVAGRGAAGGGDDGVPARRAAAQRGRQRPRRAHRRDALVPDTREDPDYIARDPQTDPRSELSVPISSTSRCGAC